jgi:kynurenine formamidase
MAASVAQAGEGPATHAARPPGVELVDLSIAFSVGMPKYPAEWFPAFEVTEVSPPVADFRRRFTTVQLFAHNGTHVESSDHVLRDGVTIDAIPLERLAGYPRIVDFADVPDATEIGEALLRERLAAAGPLAPGAIVLLRNGYDDRRWGAPDFWERSPYLSPQAAAALAAARPALIGLDFQTEKPGERDFVVHRALVAHGAVLCEFLFNLAPINERTLFMALPVKLAGVEASPVRAVGVRGLA